jgi:enoyl-CoA hydratase
MAYETLLVETRGRVGLITLNRPQALNALNRKLLDELRGVLAAFEADAGIGAIVITGSEKAFAAGADIKEMQPYGFADAMMEDLAAGWDDVAACRKPMIAAVSGFALGGGCVILSSPRKRPSSASRKLPSASFPAWAARSA